MSTTETTKTVVTSHPESTQSSQSTRRIVAIEDERPFYARIADQIAGPSTRAVRNVIRSPVRLAIVAILLGTSLMFVAVMVALNASVQQRVANAQSQIGTGITISPAGNGQIGGSTSSDQYITSAQVSTVEKTTGVTSISEYVTTRDTGGKIKGAVAIPTNIPTFAAGQNGTGTGTNTGRGFFGAGSSVDGTIAPTIQGKIPGQSPLTLSNGVSLTIKSGRNLATTDTKAKVALTSQTLATANGYKLGSTISLNGTNVTIVGLYAASDRFDENTIILPLQTAQSIYKIDGVTGLTAYADSISDVDTVASRLRTALGSNLSVVSQAQVYTDTIDALRSTETTIHTALLISAIVAALVIIFAVFLIVRERTREIGLLRAIGASHLQIVGQFAVETLTLGIVAALVATGLIAIFAGTIARQFAANAAGTNAARTGGRIFTGNGGGSGTFTPPAGGFGGFGGFAPGLGNAANRTLSAGLTPTTVLLVFLLGIGLAIVASAIPAWYVARVRPAEALRAAG